MATPSENGPRRARAVSRAFAAAGLKDGEALAVKTPDGREVHIENVTATISGGRSEIAVHLAGMPIGGDPSFVIVNPPTLVPDPTGDVLIRGQRFREDPLGALAMVLADNGGAAQKARRRGRR
jgi:hypothetical protein